MLGERGEDCSKTNVGCLDIDQLMSMENKRRSRTNSAYNRRGCLEGFGQALLQLQLVIALLKMVVVYVKHSLFTKLPFKPLKHLKKKNSVQAKEKLYQEFLETRFRKIRVHRPQAVIQTIPSKFLQLLHRLVLSDKEELFGDMILSSFLLILQSLHQWRYLQLLHRLVQSDKDEPFTPTPTAVETPTAPPSPIPVRQGRALSRHDTFFLAQTPMPTAVETPTAPPSPSPVRQGRALRRNNTIFSLAQMQTDSIHPDYTDFEALAKEQVSDWETREASSSRVNLDECWEEVALQNTPLSALPPGVSLEQYVRESLNRRRIEGFLAYAYSLEDSTPDTGSSSIS
ncbi:hypothetical protein C8R42DRAFT_646836 [Lentinula raphanica]|nr:hypothetical protein C8R42DRAFT_646836 [Lentinula raphanica]